MSPGPDQGRARAAYRRHAETYDRRPTVRGILALQRRAIDRLELPVGARVVDVACGTGLAFAELQRRIGPSGELVGVDLSADMLDRARARVDEHGSSNVRLVEAPVEEADLGGDAFDGALFSFAHDVLQSGAAVDAVVGAVRTGGRVATTGIQWAPRLLAPVNAAVWLGARRYVTTFEGFDRPFRRLEERLDEVRVERAWLGSMYVVSGRVRT